MHTYKIALYQPQGALDATTVAYTTTQEVTGSGYVAGGQVLTGYSSSFTNGVGYLTFANPQWPASTFSAGGALIYNTSGSHAVAVIAFDQTYTATNGTFTVTLPAAGSATALIRIN